MKLQEIGMTDWRDNLGQVIRTDGYIIYLCTEGSADVLVDMSRQQFKKGDLLIITVDVCMFISKVSDDFRADYISLPAAAMEAAYFKVTDRHLWDYLHYSPILRLSPKLMSMYLNWLGQMQWIFDNAEGVTQINMLNNNSHNLFMAIEIELSQHKKDIIPPGKNRAWNITNRLWQLITKHITRQRAVAFYAAALNITPDYLNKVCRKIYGVPTKEILQQQLVIEVKSLLANTTLSIHEITSRLNFDDASYLCRFFKRQTGMSPGVFRSWIRDQKQEQ